MKKKARQFKRALSAGAVVFHEFPEGRKYLLLKYRSLSSVPFDSSGKPRRKKGKDYWGFPKGHVEGETPQVTARREIFEETGISKIEFLPGFEKKIKYIFRDGEALVSKEVIYFLCQALSAEVKISHEHNGYGWFLYEEARKTLSFNKEILQAAEDFLRNRQSLF